MAQMVNNLPAMRETWVQSLGWEYPPEVGIATHSCSILPEEFQGQKDLAEYSPLDPKELDTTEQLTLTFKSLTGLF